MQADTAIPTRPEVLCEGSVYTWHARAACRQADNWETVRLIGYTPCPAVVIVRLDSGTILPIPREELYRS